MVIDEMTQCEIRKAKGKVQELPAEKTGNVERDDKTGNDSLKRFTLTTKIRTAINIYQKK